MGFKEINELMNYNYETKGTELYKIFIEFIQSNNEVLTKEQLKSASESLLPPLAFDDDRKRTKENYDKAQATVEMVLNSKLEKGKGMVA